MLLGAEQHSIDVTKNLAEIVGHSCCWKCYICALKLVENNGKRRQLFRKVINVRRGLDEVSSKLVEPQRQGGNR
jgi:hypothetical protein